MQKYESYSTSRVNYNTKVWSTGLGGFEWTCPKTGLYYVKGTFYPTTDGSGVALSGNWQFQLKLKSASSSNIACIGSESGLNTNSMNIISTDTIIQITKDDVVYPYFHTNIGSVVLVTMGYFMRIK